MEMILTSLLATVLAFLAFALIVPKKWFKKKPKEANKKGAKKSVKKPPEKENPFISIFQNSVFACAFLTLASIIYYCVSLIV